MKKVYFLLLSLFFISQAGQAQQKPQYSQYMLNGYLVNPALTGVENYLDVKASYRSQWGGLAGTPNSFYLTAHTPIGKQDRSSSIVSLPARGKHATINALRLRSENDFRFLKPHHGFGGMVIGDQIGPEKRLGASLSYAYHRPLLQNKYKLSAGISAGFTQYTLDLSRLDFGGTPDPVTGQYREAQVLPEISAGAVFYGRRFYLGAAAAQLFQSAIDLNGNPSASPDRFANHYFLHGGYEYRLSREVAIQPSVLVKFVAPSPVSVDLNMKVAYLKKMWAGASYRHQNAVAALAGVNLNTLVNLGYAYEMATSNLNQYNNGSHEILVGVILNNTYKVRGPFNGK